MSTASPPGDPEERRPGTIQSVSIAVRFLTVLANAEEPLALGVLARRTDTGGSTAHRYMQSLVKEGLARQDAQTGLYDLGPLALSVGIAALKRTDAVEIAARHMKALASQIAASGGVAIWTERGPTLVRWYRSAYFSISSLALGDILPLDNTACGLVFQAFLDPHHVEAARQRQPDSFRGTPPPAEVLDRIRRERRAELTGHLLPEITGQAVPVFDAQHELVCVMTTVTNLGQVSKPEDRDALTRAALAVAQETGGQETGGQETGEERREDTQRTSSP
ncbi:IclR family transcriptional regulator [Pararhodospirillum photometricum]|uniref:Transcriptional regulator, IclR family n=1 Tax=Pararhodospirillum photometricum DSM 122 TaxID=1150469 RepID=H6SMV1_PARPM|nr:IclR family transcriptional regulator [Pararhodospirillum photometricum]CCG09236.1 Transcriptional regulator, IclR family [Pararhodospirillum photometricum DSM 122]